jgi:hypothetical protein
MKEKVMLIGLLCVVVGLVVLACRRRPTTPDPRLAQRAGDLPDPDLGDGARMRMLRIRGGGLQ